ncbi:unnamed protein product [Medioppia subpectinata]|uniref:Neurotransmitter-gated ion-channel transmembrane domain-containing protein n=1 Tax=Medioppia subpectinata TaxID=1979941 RepID=A0A7R9KJ98_9ACAR|nr:unnamed protein product [Medioppia subpectinata]CAG2104413.1 unnamed protein product [Medioppia subpectinata]
MNLQTYPMDRHICHYSIRTFSEPIEKVSLHWIEDKSSPIDYLLDSEQNKSVIYKNEFTPSLFDIEIGNYERHIIKWFNENYTVLDLEFIFERTITANVLTVYIPSSLVVTLSWIQFWFDVEAVPGRMALGIMSTLTIMTQILTNYEKAANHVTAVDIWLLVCLIMVFLALMEYAFAYTMSHYYDIDGNLKAKNSFKKNMSLIVREFRSTKHNSHHNKKSTEENNLFKIVTENTVPDNKENSCEERMRSMTELSEIIRCLVKSFNEMNVRLEANCCDTGFGNLLAQQLDSKGFTVFASCLDPESKGAQDLLNNCSKRLKVLKLDVTNDEDVKEAVNFVTTNLHNNNLWAVVNNAGILHFLPIEWGEEGVDVYSRQLNVNALGQVRVTKAFLPLLRKTKDSRVINVESLAGRIPMPGISSYSMSKFAVRAFSECLRNEVKQFDINVSVIEPSVYSTGLTDYNLWIDDFQTKWKETPEDVRRDYGPEKCDVLHERIDAVMATSKDRPQEVVDAMIDSVTNVTPKPYYYVYGLEERVMTTLLEALPPQFFDLALNEKIYFPLIKLFKNKNRI